MRLVWEKAPVPASDIVAQLQTRHDWQARGVSPGKRVG